MAQYRGHAVAAYDSGHVEGRRFYDLLSNPVLFRFPRCEQRDYVRRQGSLLGG